MTETDLSRAIVEALGAVGVEAIRVQSGTVRFSGRTIKGAKAGTPDLLLVLFRLSFLEVKTSTGRLSSVQLSRHDELSRRGARVAVVRSAQDALAVVRRWRDEDRAIETMVKDREALRRAGLD